MRTQLLVIGAGPYGLSTAACARARGIDTVVVGKPLELWKQHMPRGMFLRSAPDWHLDALEVATFDSYLELRGRSRDERPVALDTFIDYASWFCGQYGVAPVPSNVTHLQHSTQGYRALLEDGRSVDARNVALCLGFSMFKWIPEQLAASLPAGSFAHTCDAVDLERYRGRRVLIVGGRQSAFEWAALLHEHGARAVDLTYRHPTPSFTEPDWSWTFALSRRMLGAHGWWRELSAADRESIMARFWAAGRLTLEPWLDERVRRPSIRTHQQSEIVAATRQPDGSLQVTLRMRESAALAALEVDDVILATGYRADLRRVAFLDGRSIAAALMLDDGLPPLDTEFQSRLPGMYITGLPAMHAFGPFFGFTVACPVAAKVIVDAVAERIGLLSAESALMGNTRTDPEACNDKSTHAATAA